MGKPTGWQKLLYKASMMRAYVCPLCQKPTPYEYRVGHEPSPVERQAPEQDPRLIKPGDNKYEYDWQCSHCKAWHRFPIGFIEDTEDDLI